jgi:hypothetical protein
MKKINQIILVLLFIGLNSTYAQVSDSEWNYMLIREDVVKPSMTTNYEASLTDLTQFFIENKANDVNYITNLQDNYHYMHVSKLSSLDDIHKGIKTYINGDKASDEIKLIWSDLNESIDHYRSYVMKYEPKLSYVIDHDFWLEDRPYRRWNYYYFQSGTEKQVDQILAAWKNLYKNKGVSQGFRVFKGVIGIEQPVVLFITWSDSPLNYQINLQESIKLLGEDGPILWMAMMELVRKVETIEGWYLPQYSYIPE